MSRRSPSHTEAPSSSAAAADRSAHPPDGPPAGGGRSSSGVTGGARAAGRDAASPPGPPPAPELKRTLYIKPAQANFREGPGVTARILAVLKKGTRLEVLEEENHWYRVKLADGREGWVAESVVTEILKYERMA